MLTHYQNLYSKSPLEDNDDIKSKSKTTQAIKLFSELKTPAEVAIALDLIHFPTTTPVHYFIASC